MLRITQTSGGTSGVKNYYSKGLETSDYYTKELDIPARWNGKTAEHLGLSGKVTTEDFYAIIDNKNPITNEQITARNSNSPNKRIGYDFTFNAPKSVSMSLMLGRDDRIIKAFNDAVNKTMSEVENDMETRVRKNNKNENRNTGNILWGNFTHLTSRPVDGIPDMHLHTHAYVFNITYDEKEKMFKAGQFGNIKRNGQYYESLFHGHLSNNIKQLGYEIERNKKGWEIAGISKELRDKFSLRTKEVEQEAKRKEAELKELNKIRESEGKAPLQFTANDKSELGARTRNKKTEEFSTIELIEKWKNRLSDDERKILSNINPSKNSSIAIEKKKGDANEIIDYALEHSLERRTTISEKKLLTEAFKNSYGMYSPDEIKKALAKSKNAIKRKYDKEVYITSTEALREERHIIETGTKGKGRFKPINQSYQPKAEFLNQQQRSAIYNTLSSKDQITIIEGRAGTGKTTLMKEVMLGVEENKKSFFAIAPTTQAADVQLKEGFGNAKTVAAFIVHKEQHKDIKNGVLWVDEASMIGNKDMSKLLNIAKNQNARIILTGDKRQHRSVPRGNAMELLQKKAGVKTSLVKEIQRQRNAKKYKEVVKLISDKKIDDGLIKLDEIGGIKEIHDTETRNNTIVNDYIASINKNQKTLIVAPTHIEGNNITQTLRTKLKDKKIIGNEEKIFLKHRNKNLTEAQKKLLDNYEAGNIIEFNQNHKGGFVRGKRYNISNVSEDGVLVTDNSGKNYILPIEQSKKYQVFQKEQIALSRNDTIMLTKTGKSIRGKKLNNGAMYKVAGFTDDGHIKLSNNTVINKGFANLKHGYTITSYASQGKTVDNVLIAQSSLSYPASSQKQLYVSISRGRKSATVYTDSKNDFKTAVNKNRGYLSASDLVDNGKATTTKRLMFFKRVNELKKIYATKAKEFTHLLAQKFKKDGKKDNPEPPRR